MCNGLHQEEYLSWLTAVVTHDGAFPSLQQSPVSRLFMHELPVLKIVEIFFVSRFDLSSFGILTLFLC